MTANPWEEDETDEPVEGALAVLRRGLAASPALRRGFGFTLATAFASAAGRLTIPILLQQTIDKGVSGEEVDTALVGRLCGIALGVIILVWMLQLITQRRLIRASEQALYDMRVNAFDHVHRLSLADHEEARRGLLVTRVTSDVETIARFTEWGGVSWIINGVLILGTVGVLTFYSWQLTLVILAAFLPMFPILGRLQRLQLAAYDRMRSRTADYLSEVSEAVTGAEVVRAYGIEDVVGSRLGQVINHLYRASLRTARYFAMIFPVADLFGALALASAIVTGVIWGPGWGLTAAELIACLFLVNLVISPISELTEILDQTQTAIAGWRKVLRLMDVPIDVREPDPGASLPSGPLSVRLDAVDFSYRNGPPVLLELNVDLDPGARVAVVGETGSGKSTFAKLLVRLVDPTTGRVQLAGTDLAEVAPADRRRAIRMVPQDGFLFDDSIRENLRRGRADSTDADIDAAVTRLGLADWVDRLPDGLDTRVGQRGDNLSVGERQLVALIRAQLADPGLLILDEATSAVDSETDAALTRALQELAHGRTMVSVAHRLSTAEASDLVLVFDDGRIVERGTHDELVTLGGVYAGLYDSWLGATRSAEPA